MHLCVPVETQQVRKVDLNWTCLFCSYGNGTVRLRTGPISGSLFRTTRKKHQQEKRVSLIYWERVTSLVSEMHLCVPVETQQVRKVDLNRTCLFCSYGNGTVRLRTGLISGSLFRTTRILDLFWTSSLDFFHTPV